LDWLSVNWLEKHSLSEVIESELLGGIVKARRLVSVISLFIILILTLQVPAQELLLKDKQLLITLGNSITEGGEQPEGYVSLMRKVLEVLYPEQTLYITNVGIGGHKSTDMNDRFERDVLQYKPDWVTISVGVNDVWHGFYDNHPKGDGPRGVPVPMYKEKVTDMILRARTINTKVALFTATVIKEDLSSPENKKLVQYNKAVREMAKKHKCLLVDMDKAFRQVLQPLQKPGMADRGVLTNDGVHMLPVGNWLMAKTALVAFGVSAERIEQAKPQVQQLIDQEKEARAKSLARYTESNYEVGAPREGEQRVVFYGSSSVDMWNLAKDCPRVSFLNRGIGGETSRDLAMRFGQDVSSLKPAAAIIFFGSCNDFWPDKRMSTAETKSNLIKMARYAERNKIKLAIGSISPVNDYLPDKDLVTSHPVAVVQELNAWIKDFCQKNGHVFIDFYTPVADASSKLAASYTDDGMHCNAVGYEQWKLRVVQALKDLGAWKE